MPALSVRKKVGRRRRQIWQTRRNRVSPEKAGWDFEGQKSHYGESVWFFITWSAEKVIFKFKNLVFDE